MIYTGNYQESTLTAVSQYPSLTTMTEKEMINFDYRKLNGYWVNNHVLLTKVPYDMIGVICNDGLVKKLNTHPKYETWKDEFSASEFYSIVGTNW